MYGYGHHHCHPGAAARWAMRHGWGHRRRGGPGGALGGERDEQGGGFGRFGGRMFGQGDLRLAILQLIADKPRHGYEVIKAMEDRFGGVYAPSPGTVYPTLTLLEDQGYASASTDAAGKRVFAATEAGRAWLEENRGTVDGLFSRIDSIARSAAGEEAVGDLRQAMHALRHAVRLRYGRPPWTTEEIARIRSILEQAARDIEKV